MFKSSKFFFVATLAALVFSTASAELVFEQTSLELHPALGDEKAVGHFKYQNKGDKPIAIKNVSTSCGCTAASAKQTAAPGEKGEVTATFNIGDRIGTQQKAITVVTDDPAHPTTMLTLKVVIPQMVEIQPSLVVWQTNEPPKAKTITAKAGKDVSVKTLDVASSGPDFTAKVDPGSSPDEFKISVEPKQTSKIAGATLTIKPVLTNGKSKTLYATARVMPAPGASSVASAAGAAPSANATSNQSKLDPCALLTTKDIESVQGEALKETKGSSQAAGGLLGEQCYFALPTLSNSISLSVTQIAEGPDARSPKQFWDETFHRGEKAEKERGEKEEEARPPKKIDGVGDEAFWSGNRVGGALYVLKGDKFIRISVGGAGDEATKIAKSKKLAEMALKRL
jgi:hypothetical protein